MSKGKADDELVNSKKFSMEFKKGSLKEVLKAYELLRTLKATCNCIFWKSCFFLTYISKTYTKFITFILEVKH